MSDEQQAQFSTAEIAHDAHMERHYIPLPGGWEMQTKGKGSTFRLCDTKSGDRWPVLDHFLHDALERMAREVRGASAPAQAAPSVGGEVRLAAHQTSQTTTATPQGVASTDQLGRAPKRED